jgi:hypothetical protein
MAVQEEIFKLRMQTEGEGRIKALNDLLDRQRQELADLRAAYNSMDTVAFIAAEQRIGAAIARTTKEIEQQSVALEKANRHRLGKLSVNDRSVIGFGTAQAIQDVASTGNPAHAVNNLLFMAQMTGGVKNLGQAYATMGKEAASGLARLATGHPIAAAAIAATTGGLVLLDKGLKDANLSWSDLDTVIANTAPWQAATEAISGTVDVLGETGLGKAVASAWDGLGNLIHSTADLALGWDSATEAARQHNEELARTAARMEAAAKAQQEFTKILSPEQQADDARGKQFGQALADLGGEGGAAGLIGQLATGEGERRQEDLSRLWEIAGRAEGGDDRGMTDLIRLAEGRGLDTTTLVNARAGVVNAPAAEYGPDRAVMEAGLEAEADAAEAEKQAVKDRLDRAAEQFELDQRPDEWGELLAEDDAKAEKARQRALAGLMVDPIMRGASTFDAGSFVQQVQAGGAKDPAAQMEKLIGQGDRQTRLLDDIVRELRTGGRLGA